MLNNHLINHFGKKPMTSSRANQIHSSDLFRPIRFRISSRFEDDWLRKTQPSNQKSPHRERRNEKRRRVQSASQKTSRYDFNSLPILGEFWRTFLTIAPELVLASLLWFFLFFFTLLFLLGSGPVGDDDLWYHHIGEFVLAYVRVCVSTCVRTRMWVRKRACIRIYVYAC